jgi:hypothetical protein
MNFMDDYPSLLTVSEVADILRLKPSTVYGLKGLRKTRIGNGRGHVRYRKIDIVSYINAGVEPEEGLSDAGEQTQRHRKMGIPTLLSWQELQETSVG